MYAVPTEASRGHLIPLKVIDHCVETKQVHCKSSPRFKRYAIALDLEIGSYLTWPGA